MRSPTKSAFQGMAVKPLRLVWTLTLENVSLDVTDSKWSAYLKKETTTYERGNKAELLRPFAKLWLLIFASKELYDLRSTLMDVSYLICDAFGSWITLIDSAVQKLHLNIHREVLVLSRRQTRPERTVALCVRRQLTIAEMAGMPPAKVRDSRGAQWTYFPSIISGSNVPEGGWPFTLGKPTARSPAYNVVVYVQLVIIHTAIHFESTLCSTNIVLLLCLP